MNCAPAKVIGGNLKCSIGQPIGVLLSDVNHSFTDTELNEIDSFTDLFAREPENGKLYFIKADVYEPTNGENVYETLMNNINHKVGENVPSIIIKKAKLTPAVASNIAQMFADGRNCYAAIVCQRGGELVRNPLTGVNTMFAALIHDGYELAGSTTTEKTNFAIQLTNYPVERLSRTRFLDKTYNSDADYYIWSDFYLSIEASTSVVAAAAGTTLTFKALTIENKPVSGLVAADIDSILIDSVDESSKITGAIVETPAGSGTYVVTGSTAFSAGSCAVVMKAEADLSIVGYSFQTATAGILS